MNGTPAWTAVRRVLGKGLIGLAVGLLLRAFAVSLSDASHPKPLADLDGDTVLDTHEHLLTMTTFEAEDFCVANPVSGSLNQPTVLAMIRNTLQVDSPSEDWDGLGGWKVSFAGRSQPCSAQDAPFTEVSYSVADFWCDPNNFKSCARFLGTSEAYNPVTGHYEYRQAGVTFQSAHLEDGSFWRHVINHETGHVLGLADGDGTCPDSVMHNIFYGCQSNRDWPSASDHASVAVLIPITASGGCDPGRAMCGWSW